MIGNLKMFYVRIFCKTTRTIVDIGSLLVVSIESYEEENLARARNFRLVALPFLGLKIFLLKTIYKTNLLDSKTSHPAQALQKGHK